MRLTLATALLVVSGLAHAAPSAEQQAFTAYLIGPQEPKVKDATWMTDSNLYVAVVNDGSDRSGFAQYVCMAAKDHGVQPDLVKVVDIAKVLNEKKFVELGSTYCPKASEGETEVKFF